MIIYELKMVIHGDEQWLNGWLIVAKNVMNDGEIIGW